MDTETKNFEIAYLVSSDVQDDDVVRVAGAITGVIGELHGLVRHVEEPVKRRLSYPIGKQKWAFFGYTTFSITPPSLAEVQKRLTSVNEILRWLIVEEEREPVRVPIFRPSWKAREEAAPILQRGVPRSEAEAPAVSPEEREAVIKDIDKRLDEILGA